MNTGRASSEFILLFPSWEENSDEVFGVAACLAKHLLSQSPLQRRVTMRHSSEDSGEAFGCLRTEVPEAADLTPWTLNYRSHLSDTLKTKHQVIASSNSRLTFLPNEARSLSG